jgi:asparagine synthase (glutamine-hydrolysing)
MCGICGIVIRDRSQSAEASVLQRMSTTMAHRGPDGEGVWIHGQYGLGHRRLKIIDLSENARQPMATASGDAVITYNGEVYNFEALRREHFAGEPFVSSGDSEVVLRLIDRLGVDAVALLDGLFAFAVVKPAESKVILARDPFGIKPLYYSFDNRRLVFGSEIKALRASGRVSNELSMPALNDFFDFMWIPAPRSIYRDIQKLEPAHFAELDTRTWSMRIERYWKPRYHPVNGLSSADWIEKTAETLIRVS